MKNFVGKKTVLWHQTVRLQEGGASRRCGRTDVLVGLAANVSGDVVENRARHTIYVTFCTPNLMTLSSSSPLKRKWCNAK